MEHNYYKHLIDLLKKEEDYAENLVRHLLLMATEEEVNSWIAGWKPEEKGKLDDILGQWEYGCHKALRQADIFELKEGHLDMALWNALQLSHKWTHVFREAVLPTLDIESQVV